MLMAQSKLLFLEGQFACFPIRFPQVCETLKIEKGSPCTPIAWRGEPGFDELGATAKVIGFGQTHTGVKSSTNVLMETTEKVLMTGSTVVESEQECSFDRLPGTQLCAVGDGSAFCHGDSGGHWYALEWHLLQPGGDYDPFYPIRTYGYQPVEHLPTAAPTTTTARAAAARQCSDDVTPLEAAQDDLAELRREYAVPSHDEEPAAGAAAPRPTPGTTRCIISDGVTPTAWVDAAREWNVEPCEAIDIDPPGATATERARAVAARLTVGRMHDVTRIIHAALATRKVTMFDRLGTAVGTIPGQHGHAPRPRSCGSCCGPMLRPYRVSCPAREPSTTTEPGDADHVAERALLRIMAHDPATAGDDVSARLRQTLQADDDHQQRTPEANAAYAARRRTQNPSPMAMAATDVPEDTLTRTSSLRSHCRQAAKIAAALADERRKAVRRIRNNSLRY